MTSTSTHTRCRDIFCNRTLNLRSIKAIGYDMDYTLVHYQVEAWEGRAYIYLQDKLLAQGWPIAHLEFEPERAIRGLVLDIELGNMLKINRFGYIKAASHGTNKLEYRAMRQTYKRTIVELSEDRYQFLNTFFSISEACMYAQLVDLYDEDKLPDDVFSYTELYRRVRGALDEAHLEGELKAGIMAKPEEYVVLDPQTPQALLDQKMAGKQLLLITNSEWSYTKFMMSYAFDRFLPNHMTWRDLFEIAVVSSRKPSFFTGSPSMLRVHEDTGLLEPFVGKLKEGSVYFGGNAGKIEEYLGCAGDQILYVGDHIFTDVHISKSMLRWRTALILRELEDEITEIQRNIPMQQRIYDLMKKKERLEDEYSQLRLDLQRIRLGYGTHSNKNPDDIRADMTKRRNELVELDDEIAPLVVEDGREFNALWGYLLRTGKDKSHLTRQVERDADIYTSRVSNFLNYTPFMYFRAARGSLPHDAT